VRTINHLVSFSVILLKCIIAVLMLSTLITGHSTTHQRLLDQTIALAEDGDVDAQLSLGLLYTEGQSVSQNYKEAMRWYGAAAEQGNAKAQYMIAYMYRVGLGVAQDFEKAVNWYQKSAQNGNERSQFALGFLYSVGLGVDQNSVRALSLVNIAILNGYIDESDTVRILHRQMTQNQIAYARVLATECIDSNYQYCEWGSALNQNISG